MKSLKVILFLNLILALVFSSQLISPVMANSLKGELKTDEIFLTGDFGYQGIGKMKLSPWFAYDQNLGFELGLKEAYFTHFYRSIHFSLGRKIISLGPGRYGQLMLGPLGEGVRTEGLDQFGFDIDWANLQYFKFYAWVPEGEFRMLLGQRLAYQWGALTIGLSEISLQNKEAPWLYYTPLPFFPIYTYQFLADRVFKISNNRAANIAIAADLVWRPKDNLKLYGVYYMDDRPWPRWNDDFSGFTMPQPGENPWRVGYQAGVEIDNFLKQKNLKLYGEYTRIAQFTYTGLNPELTYTYWGRVLGDPLGPDADRLNLEVVKELTADLSVGFSFTQERHGEGEIGDVWTKVPGQTVVFLTGIVEESRAIKVQCQKKYQEWHFGAELGWVFYQNYQNQLGVHHDEINCSLIGTYYWR